MPATRLIIHGKVQGVFYRDWTVENARKRELGGWVRNCSDGTVEAHLEGDDEAVEAMIAAMHEGPPRADVERIEEEDAAPEGFATFDRR